MTTLAGAATKRETAAIPFQPGNTDRHRSKSAQADAPSWMRNSGKGRPAVKLIRRRRKARPAGTIVDACSSRPAKDCSSQRKHDNLFHQRSCSAAARSSFVQGRRSTGAFVSRSSKKHQLRCRAFNLLSSYRHTQRFARCQCYALVFDALLQSGPSKEQVVIEIV